MQMNESVTTLFQEVSPVSPSIRGNRIVADPPRARGLLGLLGLSLLVLGRLPI